VLCLWSLASVAGVHPVQRGTVLQYRVSEGGVEDAQGTVRRHGCHEEAYREASKEIPPEERHELVRRVPQAVGYPF